MCLTVDDVQDGGIGEELQLLQAELLQLDAVHFLSEQKKRMRTEAPRKREKKSRRNVVGFNIEAPLGTRPHTQRSHTHTHFVIINGYIEERTRSSSLLFSPTRSIYSILSANYYFFFLHRTSIYIYI